MGVFVAKVRCPNPDHQDSTPSCGVYSDGSGFCFACGSYFRDMGIPVESVRTQKAPEDLDAKLEYIRNLPRTRIRGLELPFDNSGYYIVWPSGDYYKLRRFTVADTAPKYSGPSGISQPLFRLPGKGRTVIIEGEINALSLREAGIKSHILSPGSATSFFANKLIAYLPKLVGQDTLILVDADLAGLEGAIRLRELLAKYTPYIQIHLMEADANSILTEHGPEALKEEIEKLDLSRRKGV